METKKQVCPVAKNSRHRLTIREATAKGFGIAGINGFNVFVDGGLPGDVIDAHIVKVKKSYAYGKIKQIITPSPHRVKSPCPVSQNCGGCQWLHCEYSAQLAFKKKIVTDALERIGGVKSPPVRDVIGMENPGRYRNKAVFPVTPEGIGMYAPRSHSLIEVTDCLIQHEAHISVLAAVKSHMRRHKIPAYNETTHKGLIRHIIVRTSLAFPDEKMVVLVANLPEKHGLPAAAELTHNLTAAGISTLILNRNTHRTNTIMSDNFEILSGTGYIHEKIGEIKYQLSAPSFFQINPVQTEILYSTAIKQAQLNSTQFAIDAHAGVGGVALYAAARAKQVLGVDIVPEAISDAQKNAALNGITNAEFICGPAEEIIPALLQTNSTGSCELPVEKYFPREKADVIFLDPPRKGCDPALPEAIISAKIKRVVYISCDPATLARDVKILTQGGYELVTAQPVDMFPFTGKVECVSVLQRTDT